MTVTLVFLALLMAGFLGWLLRQSINVKPWVAAGPVSEVENRGPQSFAPARVGLAVFIAVATSLFALCVSAYMMRMHMGDWQSLESPVLLWVNTGVLVLGSVALQAAWGAAKRGDTGRMRTGLLVGGACTMVFVIGQYVVWRQLMAAGYYATSNAANAFFYMLTALHALHLLGGLVAWGRTMLKLWRGAELDRIRMSVELCAIYWHFLLVIWVILFGLLLIT